MSLWMCQHVGFEAEIVEQGILAKDGAEGRSRGKRREEEAD
jgi:hypothetical protein